MSHAPHTADGMDRVPPAAGESTRKAQTARLGVFPHGTIVRGFLFATLLGLIYISMRNYYVSLWRAVHTLEEEVTNLHYEAITTQSELMRLGSASEVRRLVEERHLGLEPSKHPPVKIKMVKP